MWECGFHETVHWDVGFYETCFPSGVYFEDLVEIAGIHEMLARLWPRGVSRAVEDTEFLAAVMEGSD